MAASTVDEAWRTFQLHLRWARDAWIVFVWASGSDLTHRLLAHAQTDFLASQRSLRVLRPNSRDELRHATEHLLQPANEETCVWLEAVRFSSFTAGPRSNDPKDPWHEAWRWLLQRLNEGREEIARTFRGGLVLAMPDVLKKEVAALAPDLWSIRSLALELELDEERERAAHFHVTVPSAPPHEVARNLDLARADVILLEKRLAAFDEAPPKGGLPERLALCTALGRALNHLASALLLSAREDEARAPVSRAVALLGDVAKMSLSRMERTTSAARALTEAERAEILHQREQTILPSLAESLSTQSVLLAIGRRHSEALAAIREAVAIYRDLAAKPSDVHTPALATSLDDLANRLAALDPESDEALAIRREALAIYRELASRVPGVYLPHLAMSLNNVGTTLNSLGRYDEALPALKEAVDLYRELIQSHPETHLSNLAMSLHNLSNTFAATSHLDAAVDTYQEVVSIRRELAEFRPESFSSSLAKTLGMWFSLLATVGRHEEALDVAKEALAILRSLAAKQPDVFLPDLVMSLHNQGNWLATHDHHEDARAALGEALTIVTREPRPGTLTPAWIQMLIDDYRRICGLACQAPDAALIAAAEAATESSGEA